MIDEPFLTVIMIRSNNNAIRVFCCRGSNALRHLVKTEGSSDQWGQKGPDIRYSASCNPDGEEHLVVVRPSRVVHFVTSLQFTPSTSVQCFVALEHLHCWQLPPIPRLAQPHTGCT